MRVSETQFPKRCGCGRAYEAVQWGELACLGEMRLPDRRALELRNCHCGSTLTVREASASLEAQSA